MLREKDTTMGVALLKSLNPLGCTIRHGSGTSLPPNHGAAVSHQILLFKVFSWLSILMELNKNANIKENISV